MTKFLEIKISEANIKVLNQLLMSSSSRVQITSLKRTHVVRRIRARILNLGLNSFQEYFNFVSKDKEELNELILTFSINVTHFFRNYDTFLFLQKQLLPLIHSLSSGRLIKIWSAGCADGAEPYSLAMICASINLKPGQVQIYATDYNPELIKQAKKGIYSKSHLKETPSKMFKFFHTDFENIKNQFKIDPGLSSYVKFGMFNLITDPVTKLPHKFDLILCRNVLIYFTKEEHTQIYEKFYHFLKKDGFLVIGRSEILLGKKEPQFSIYNSYHRVSRKL